MKTNKNNKINNNKNNKINTMKICLFLALVSVILMASQASLAYAIQPGMMTWGARNMNSSTTTAFGAGSYFKSIIKTNITLPFIADTKGPLIVYRDIDTGLTIRGIPLFFAFDYVFVNEFIQLTYNQTDVCGTAINGRVFVYSGDGELYYCDDGVMEKLSS
jgi:hypothetical protein